MLVKFGLTILLCSTQRKQTGNRVIKPKKASLIKHDQMKKVRNFCVTVANVPTKVVASR
jgi:hypothetical protein